MEVFLLTHSQQGNGGLEEKFRCLLVGLKMIRIKENRKAFLKEGLIPTETRPGGEMFLKWDMPMSDMAAAPGVAVARGLRCTQKRRAAKRGSQGKTGRNQTIRRRGETV
jgi:hypothetical protein